MKPLQSPFLHAITLMMALVQPSHAEVEWKPLSLAQRGRFIELQRGEFVRASSINVVHGKMTLTTRRKKTNATEASRSFPLSLDGIKELKSTKRTALIKEWEEPEDKAEDFEFSLEVVIGTNIQSMVLLSIRREDASESWDKHEKALNEAVASLDKLIEIASESEPPAPKDVPR